MNILFDMYRFLFGRGVLFGLSSYWLFVFLLIVDFAGQFKAFIVKYVEALFVFHVKHAIPDGHLKFAGLYKKFTKILDLYTQLSNIPRRLQVCWVNIIDFRLSLGSGLGRFLPETSLKVGMQFLNVKFEMRNLPYVFEYDYVDTLIRERMELANDILSSHLLEEQGAMDWDSDSDDDISRSDSRSSRGEGEVDEKNGEKNAIDTTLG